MKFREEITDWKDENIPNHIYVTEGKTLIGYVQNGDKTVHWFKQPKKQWSTTHRKFRDLGKKEIAKLSL